MFKCTKKYKQQFKRFNLKNKLVISKFVFEQKIFLQKNLKYSKISNHFRKFDFVEFKKTSFYKCLKTIKHNSNKTF